MKKLFLGVAVAAMAFSMLGTGNIMAAEDDSKDVDVIYDNSNIIPGDEDWGVRVPASIIFTDDKKTVDAPVELIGLNGAMIDQMDVSVKVSVSSNSMLMNLVAGNDPVAYTLEYNNVTMSAADKILSTSFYLRSKDRGQGEEKMLKMPGTAVMTGTAIRKGEHKDVLTYQISELDRK